MKKILLVNPPLPVDWYNNEYYLPTSLLYLGSVLRDNGDGVKILDMKALKPDDSIDRRGFYTNALINAVSSFQPDLIGFGCLFSGNFPDVFQLAEFCKERFSNIPIVAGGIHFTIYAKEILANCPCFDWIILGEAEESIVQLANAMKDKKPSFASIDGFAYRQNGAGIINPKRSYVENIDQISFPAYDLVNLKDYYVDTACWHNPKGLPINTSIPIISSRSCPYHCNFCSMFTVMGPKWRGRSAQNVVDEIEYLYNNYNHRHFSFMDDNFTFSKPRILEICQEIRKRNLDIQFETPNGLSLRTLDREVLDALVSAGLIRVYLAIESGSDFIRNKIMKKNISRKEVIEIARLAKSYKQLYVNAFFIIGMPEETKETLAETYDMIEEINVDKIHIHNLIPYPCTDVFKQAVRDNLLTGIDPEDLYKSPDFYFKNSKRFFIKPYNLQIKDLGEFKEKCDKLISAHGQPYNKKIN